MSGDQEKQTRASGKSLTVKSQTLFMREREKIVVVVCHIDISI